MVGLLWAVAVRPASLSGCSGVYAVVPSPAGGQVARAGGGPQVWVNSRVQACCQGQPAGRCRVSCRAEDATRAGTWISLRRMVAVVAFARPLAAVQAAE